ncbi:hypothetical protein [Spirillospora sp. CA-294931]|uniref:hypothetical protein n=1 Tax=Spirillospora sp. CA-294931 TaxID=3240042 RepID=UPI003D8FC738
MSLSRPGQLTAAAALVGAAWSLLALLLALMTWNAYDVVELVESSEVVEFEAGVSQRIVVQYGVYWILLVIALCALCWAIPRVFGGREAGRVTLWVVTGAISLVHLSLFVVEVAGHAADAAMVFLALVGVATSGVAAVLVGLPPVNAYLRTVQASQPNPHSHH